MIKEESKPALEYHFSKLKRKIYYDTNTVMRITGISERTLRYRLSTLKEEYRGLPSLLFQKNREWKIHNSILDEFIPKYKNKGRHLVNRDWKSFVTWSPRDKYCKDYHALLMREIINEFPEEEFPTEKFFSVLEKNKSGVHHVHFLSVYYPDEVSRVVNNVLNKYLLKENCRVEVAPVYSRAQAITYVFKERILWND